MPPGATRWLDGPRLPASGGGVRRLGGRSRTGAGDEGIMSIAGHVSRAMLSRYSHVRMEAKRRALDEIAVRQRAADEKRTAEAELRERSSGGSCVSPAVQ